MIEYVVIARGTRFAIRALRRPSDQDSLVKQYFESLETSQRKKIHRRISLLAEMGPAPNPQKSRKLSGVSGLYELKEKPSRIFFFYHGKGVIVMTHGFDKSGDETPPEEIDRALRLREMYLAKYG
jgi:phage-related protein